MLVAMNELALIQLGLIKVLGAPVQAEEVLKSVVELPENLRQFFALAQLKSQ
jgi:hypothetical protein